MVDVNDWYDIQDIHNDYGAKYNLQNNLDSNTNGYDDIASSNANNGQGFRPIGTKVDNDGRNQFRGTFNGNGYTIEDLYIDRSDETNTGFIAIGDGTLKNTLFSNAYINGADNVGVWGNANRNDGFGGATIRRIGVNSGTTIIGDRYVGSIAGRTDPRTVIEKTYSLGDVDASTGDCGGIAGYLRSRISVRIEFRRNYYAGNISSAGSIDPLGNVGLSSGNNEFNYWDTEVTGLGSSDCGATGLTTSEMTADSAVDNMTNYDFSSTGNWKTTSDYPDLKNLSRKTLTVNTLVSDPEPTKILMKGDLAETAGKTVELRFNIRKKAAGKASEETIVVKTTDTAQAFEQLKENLDGNTEYEVQAVAKIQ